MSGGFSVDPTHLLAAATRCEQAAQTADGVLRSVSGAGLPDPGRPDSGNELARVLDALAAGLTSLGTALVADAAALTGAAATYGSTDRGAAGR